MGDKWKASGAIMQIRQVLENNTLTDTTKIAKTMTLLQEADESILKLEDN